MLWGRLSDDALPLTTEAEPKEVFRSSGKIHAGCTHPVQYPYGGTSLSHSVTAAGPSSRAKPAPEKMPGLLVITAPAHRELLSWKPIGNRCLASRELASSSTAAPPPVFDNGCPRCLRRQSHHRPGLAGRHLTLSASIIIVMAAHLPI